MTSELKSKYGFSRYSVTFYKVGRGLKNIKNTQHDAITGNNALPADNGALHAYNGALRADNGALRADNGALRADNIALRVDNGALRASNIRH